MSCASTAAWNGASPSSSSPAGEHPRRCGRPPRALEIAGIVLGFIYAWPLALAYLVWKCTGYPLAGEAKAFFQEKFGRALETPFRAPFGTTGNAAFEDYRRRELDRLEEERRRLDEEAQAFRGFVEELKRAKDREEFDAFMARRRSGGASGTTAV